MIVLQRAPRTAQKFAASDDAPMASDPTAHTTVSEVAQDVRPREEASVGADTEKPGAVSQNSVAPAALTLDVEKVEAGKDTPLQAVSQTSYSAAASTTTSVSFVTSQVGVTAPHPKKFSASNINKKFLQTTSSTPAASQTLPTISTAKVQTPVCEYSNEFQE